MNIVMNKDKGYVLLQNSDGEYHMSLDQFNNLGEDKAKEYALKEINLKKDSSYTDKTIDFKRARSLGFCKYGIEDFCKLLKLDIDKTYKLSDLRNTLTKEVFISYPDECLKLFSKSIFDKFGGPIKFLDKNRNRNVFSLVLKNTLSEKQQHKISCEFALRCVDKYEKEYLNDNRVRAAIEAKLKD